MLLVGSPLLVFSVFDTSPLVATAFGAHWVGAAKYVCPVALMCYAMLVATPLGSILDVTERQDLHLFREMLSVVILGAAGAVAIACQHSPLVTTYLLCAGSIAGYVAYAGISMWAILAIPGNNTIARRAVCDEIELVGQAA
jgi:hypothetical protein